MKRETVNILGMDHEKWTHKSCVAYFLIEDDWVTLSKIDSKQEGCGHCQELLIEAKKYYKKQQGKIFGGTIALSKKMKHIYQKLNIKEYD